MEPKRPKIIFRADAGASTGFGHLVRSAALASYLCDDFNCLFVCRNSDISDCGFINSLIAESGAERLDIRDTGDTSFDSNFLDVLSYDAVTVLDNYFYTTEYQQKVRSRSRALVTIDDMPDRRFDADVFFTPSPLSKSDLELADYTEFHGGLEWTFLRRPFLSTPPVRTSAKIESTVIAMGGSDPMHITDSLIGIVENVLPEARIHVIAGPAAELSDYKTDNVIVHRNLSAQEIVKLLDSVDFGIFPASTASLEAISRRLPIAVGWYVDNQYNYYRHGVEKRLFGDLGDLRRPSAKIETDLRKIIEDYNPANAPLMDFSARRNDIINIFKKLWTHPPKDA